MSVSEVEKQATGQEGFPTLSDNLGALIVSVVLLILGGLLAASGWGMATQVVGAVIALFGLITGRVTLWAILKSLLAG